MTWKNILKISTEEAISDAERFANSEVIDSSREQILDVWREMGFEVFKNTESEYLIFKREPDGMFNRHFDFLSTQPMGTGFIVKMPKDAPSLGKYDKYSVESVNDAKSIGERYQRRFDKAVETYQG